MELYSIDSVIHVYHIYGQLQLEQLYAARGNPSDPYAMATLHNSTRAKKKKNVWSLLTVHWVLEGAIMTLPLFTWSTYLNQGKHSSPSSSQYRLNEMAQF